MLPHRLQVLAVVLFAALGGAGAAGPALAAAPETWAVVGADLFDSRTATVLPQRTIVIRGERIAEVGPADRISLPAGARVLDADGGLIVPGLIDAHHHLGFVLADSMTAGGGSILHLDMAPDSIRAYRERWAAAYLPYGVTTVRDAGSSDEYRDLLRAWAEPSPDSPDFFPCGGALVTFDEGRATYPGHTAVSDPEDAARMVTAYHDDGYRFVKLYWRLQEPEFAAAYRRARELDMIPFAHVDFNVTSIPWALDLGVRQFAHAYTLIKAVLDPGAQVEILRDRGMTYADLGAPGLFFTQTLAWFEAIGPDDPRMIALIDRMAADGARVSPTLHVFAHPFGLAWFPFVPKAPFHDTTGFPPARLKSGRAGYRVLADYTRRMHEAGVALTLGTDTPDPGRAALSEILLLHEAGIPMADVLRIATLNGAVSMGLADRGAIEKDRLADLVIFARSPLEAPSNLTGPRVVVHRGRIVAE